MQSSFLEWLWEFGLRTQGPKLSEEGKRSRPQNEWKHRSQGHSMNTVILSSFRTRHFVPVGEHDSACCDGCCAIREEGIDSDGS